MEEVYNRRLQSINDDEITEVIKREALPLRMILENKRDGRLKGRLVAIGFKEPLYWDTKSNSSPVVAMSTVMGLLFKSSNIKDIISSIDISVAFLQANPYPEDAPKRYVVYKPYRDATPKYYLLKGAIYGQRSAQC